MLSRYQVMILQGIIILIYALKGSKTNSIEQSWIDAANKMIENKERE